MKKITSVNLDKLIHDFSQIEKVCKDIKQLKCIGAGRKKNVQLPSEQVKIMENFAKPFMILKCI